MSVRTAIYRYGLIGLFALLLVFFVVALPSFGTLENVFVILQSVAVTEIVALGVTVSMVAGGFDLSIGSTVSLSVMVVGACQVYLGLGTFWSVLLGLLAGILVGLTNGVLIVVARVPDMLATLGSMFVFSGLSLIITAGKSVSTGNGYAGGQARGDWSSALLWIGGGELLGVPFSVVLAVVVAVVVTVFLGRTRTGYILSALGSNPTAARLAGVRVGRYRMLAYVVSGFLSALAGVVLVARVGRGDINAGSDYLLEAVAAALIGYAVLGANRPNALGTVVGAVFVGVLVNGLTMFNVPYYTQDFIKGILLVTALIVSFSRIFNTEQEGD